MSHGFPFFSHSQSLTFSHFFSYWRALLYSDLSIFRDKSFLIIINKLEIQMWQSFAIWRSHGQKKSHFTKYLEISKREIRMFTFIHLNFEWKHSNLRLRLYLLWTKIIDKYKMIAKMLWSLIQVNLLLMFCVNEIPISLQ